MVFPWLRDAFFHGSLGFVFIWTRPLSFSLSLSLSVCAVCLSVSGTCFNIIIATEAWVYHHLRQSRGCVCSCSLPTPLSWVAHQRKPKRSTPLKEMPKEYKQPKLNFITHHHRNNFKQTLKKTFIYNESWHSCSYLHITQWRFICSIVFPHERNANWQSLHLDKSWFTCAHKSLQLQSKLT